MFDVVLCGLVCRFAWVCGLSDLVVWCGLEFGGDLSAAVWFGCVFCGFCLVCAGYCIVFLCSLVFVRWVSGGLWWFGRLCVCCCAGFLPGWVSCVVIIWLCSGSWCF